MPLPFEVVVVFCALLYFVPSLTKDATGFSKQFWISFTLIIGAALVLNAAFAIYTNIVSFESDSHNTAPTSTVSTRKPDHSRILPRLDVQLDSATGCQYLVAPNGSLTPRLDSTGKQVCK